MLGLPGSSLFLLQGCNKQEEKLVLAVLLWETTSIFLPGCPSAPLRHGNEYWKGRHGGSLPVTEEELSEHHFKGPLACVDLSLELSALFPILSHSLLEQTALGLKLQPTGAHSCSEICSGHKQGGFSLTHPPCSLAGATAPGGTD